LIITDGGYISADTLGEGNGGSISLEVDNLRMTNNASISTGSMGTGDAGNITIVADDSLVLENSSMTAATESADGGNINLYATNMLHLINSEVTTSVKGGTGDGGNISIDPIYVLLDGSDIIADAEWGRGGNISIIADYFIASPDSAVSASSRLGIDGNVVISSPALDISGNLGVLPSSFLKAANLSPMQCVLREDDHSTFIVKKRDGLPPRPDSLLASY
jgi:large exoprotein involved in heme utilization and adhesion